ncbi:MAG TPA: hypothetical protein VF540_01575 [Segetibacter sp.]|jgi:hypothetical protein
MTRREFWERLSETGWNNMAKDWLSAIKNEPIDTNEEREFSKVEMVITQMRFEAPFDKLWKFILLTLSLAETKWQVEQIGAEEVEHILGWQKKWEGADYINLVEQEAKVNGKLNLALLIVQKYMMTDEVWARVQNLKEKIKSGQLPLHEMK